ncbi:MAG TPA: NAD(P)H-dependent oxidoreductase [Devosia sp.]|jgi:putative NADPH-quinone reductase|uniref:NAD(P)H-dependent oxidoreductase n=1 Tax=Devosia sp. TaxID=1871048 RepID=UPI002F92974D
MHIYLLLAHPDGESFCGALADAYEAAAKAAGHEVRRQDLGALAFDPILHKGYREIQELEPDLVQAQELIRWCEHWVIIYPVWWGSVPALLKGFMDRAVLPGFAFKPHDEGPLWDKLLKGRSAQLITTSDAPSLYLLLAYRNSDVAMMKKAVLDFCGIKPVKLTRLGSMKGASDEKRATYLETVRRLAGR